MFTVYNKTKRVIFLGVVYIKCFDDKSFIPFKKKEKILLLLLLLLLLFCKFVSVYECVNMLNVILAMIELEKQILQHRYIGSILLF